MANPSQSQDDRFFLLSRQLVVIGLTLSTSWLSINATCHHFFFFFFFGGGYDATLEDYLDTFFDAEDPPLLKAGNPGDP